VQSAQDRRAAPERAINKSETIHLALSSYAYALGVLVPPSWSWCVLDIALFTSCALLCVPLWLYSFRSLIYPSFLW
jgi:hypothetical protein